VAGYRDSKDGEVFDLAAPIGTAAAQEPCPACVAPARRLISAPTLALAPTAFVRELDRAAQTADHPDVVTSLPHPSRRRPRPGPGKPALQRLPRPSMALASGVLHTIDYLTKFGPHKPQSSTLGGPHA